MAKPPDRKSVPYPSVPRRGFVGKFDDIGVPGSSATSWDEVLPLMCTQGHAVEATIGHVVAHLVEGAPLRCSVCGPLRVQLGPAG